MYWILSHSTSKIEPNANEKDCDLEIYSDNNWAGDIESQISITGFIFFLLGVPTCWRSNGKKGVYPIQQ